MPVEYRRALNELEGAGRGHAGGGIGRGDRERMGKTTGFLEYEREDRDYEPVDERIRHWREFVQPLPEAGLRHARPRAAWIAACRIAR